MSTRKIKRWSSHGHCPGGIPTPTYRSWMHMMDRCNNPRSERYDRYGGRGISICPRWHEFANFLADMGVRPEGTTIERIKNDGNYEQGNCRWATRKEQVNNRSYNVRLELNGEIHNVSQWSEITGIPQTTIQSRIKYGWPIQRVLTEPLLIIRKRKPKP